MRKTLSIRLSDEEQDALARAAADDERPTAAMARLLITRALAERGYLSDGGGGASRRSKGRGAAGKRGVEARAAAA